METFALIGAWFLFYGIAGVAVLLALDEFDGLPYKFTNQEVPTGAFITAILLWPLFLLRALLIGAVWAIKRTFRNLSFVLSSLLEK